MFPFFQSSGKILGIDVNKTSESKECMIGHHKHFLDRGYKYEPDVCNGCHVISIMAFEL